MYANKREMNASTLFSLLRVGVWSVIKQLFILSTLQTTSKQTLGFHPVCLSVFHFSFLPSVRQIIFLHFSLCARRYLFDIWYFKCIWYTVYSWHVKNQVSILFYGPIVLLLQFEFENSTSAPFFVMLQNIGLMINIYI